MAFLVMWIPAALRYGIGTDYMSYRIIYQNILFYGEDLEVGYVLLNNVLHWLNLDVQWIFAASSFITYIPVCFALPKKGLTVLTCFYVLTLYFASYSLVRQNMALSFIIYATASLLEGKQMKCLVLIGIASLFHLSAMFILFPLLMQKFVLNKWMWIACVAFMAYAIVSLDFIQSIFSSSLFLDTKYGSYADSSFNRETAMGSGIGVMIRCLLPVWVLFSSKKLRALNEKSNFIVIVSALYLIAYILATQIHIFNRLVDIFTFVLLFDAGAFYMYKQKNRKILFGILLLLFLTIFELAISKEKITKGGGLGISPYTTIFEK